MAEHEAISPNVPSIEVDSPRQFLIAKRPGVGRGMIIVCDDVAIEIAGDAWSALQTHFFGALSRYDYDDFDDNDKIGVAYDFCDEYFYKQELLAIKDFRDEHKLG